MTRDPVLLAECAALKRALRSFPTLAALRASSEWERLEPRLSRVLGTVRRHEPPAPPGPPSDPGRVLAVSWNIEHGNWYEQVERALRTQVQLAGADLLLFNEIDLGMARAGNRDVTAELVRALGLHGVWAPLFIETTPGRDDDVGMGAGAEDQESLFGLAILSRWPIGEVRLVDLPSPEQFQFEGERMYGRHAAMVAEILRPAEPFVAVAAHLEVHRGRRERERQIRTLLQALRHESRPIVLAGDFNTHTFERGRWWHPLLSASVLLLWPRPWLNRRFLYPDQGRTRETLFDVLRDQNFAWRRFNDRAPTLRVRMERLEEARLMRALGFMARPILEWAESRAALRLDWFAGRGWREGHGATVRGLDGPGKASDHAPIVAEFR